MIEKPSMTFKKKVGCGNIYITISEHKNGNFNQIIIHGITKDIPCGESWGWALGRILTYALRESLEKDSNITENAIIKHMKGNFCNKRIAGSEISCISAVGSVVNEYIKIRKQRGKKNETNQKTTR